MASFLVDNDFEDPVVAILRSFGHHLTTARSVGMDRSQDIDILIAATAAGLTVLTHDRDYIKLHKSGVPHGGIVLTSRDVNTAALADRIHIAVVSSATLTNLLIRVNRPA